MIWFAVEHDTTNSDVPPISKHANVALGRDGYIKEVTAGEYRAYVFGTTAPLRNLNS